VRTKMHRRHSKCSRFNRLLHAVSFNLP
jgi:hypothetical protein